MALGSMVSGLTELRFSRYGIWRSGFGGVDILQAVARTRTAQVKE
jgi:hypothetical protein